MSAQLRPERWLQDMRVDDLDEVLRVEQLAYSHPWSRGNFVDSLHAGYLAQTLRADDGALLGYFIAMPGVDEVHLLNLTVAPGEQGRGHARFMLDMLSLAARAEHHAAKLWLEVRVSNARALALYERYGFRRAGLRRGYYPLKPQQREDALVMSLDLMQIPQKGACDELV
ncbi:MAG TPA: ribosomal protein S18-alanine N-acetyltransferase [Methylibium sp.]